MRTRSALFTLVMALVLILFGTGCGRPVPERAAGDALAEGWNELPFAPYLSALEGYLAFWTGTELVVAAGTVFPEPYDHVTHHTETYTFSLETGQWRTLAPLVVPGYDGVQGLTGMWTGATWVGIAFPCKDEDVVDKAQYVACEVFPIGLRWSPTDGWTVSPQPIAPESLKTDHGFNVAGVTSTSLILVNVDGYLSYELPGSVESGWTFNAWPAGAAAATGGSACVLGDQLLTVSTILREPTDGSVFPEGQTQDFPQSLTANLLTPVGEVIRSWPVADLPLGILFAPYCQPQQGIFVYTTPGDPMLRVTADTNVPLQVPTLTDEAGGVWASVSGGWADVGTGVVELGEPRTYYLDSDAGAITVLQPVPAMTRTVWTAQALFAAPALSDQWFAFLPRGTWPESADLPFPFTIEGP